MACSSRSGEGFARDDDARASAAQAVCDYSVLHSHNDVQRTGAQTCETALTPTTVPSLSRQAVAYLDSSMGTQPLYVSGNSVNGAVQDVLILAGRRIFVMDPWTLTPIFIVPTPEASISTPVVDKAANILYTVVRTPLPNGMFELRAYNLNDMTLKASAVVGGTCAGASTVTFSATANGNWLHHQRTALLLDHGHIYFGAGAAAGVIGEGGTGYNG
jgi:hypothetical protein